jgi:hypothetical protein
VENYWLCVEFLTFTTILKMSRGVQLLVVWIYSLSRKKNFLFFPMYSCEFEENFSLLRKWNFLDVFHSPLKSSRVEIFMENSKKKIYTKYKYKAHKEYRGEDIRVKSIE